jgi:hypothetical protein
MANFWVNGIVAMRDGKPYIQLSNERGMIGQLSIAEARQVALDILVMSARSEMDAMVLAWMEKMGLPEGAAPAMMDSFRVYRGIVDQEKVEHTADGT